MRTPKKIVNKNTILVYLSIFYLFSFFTAVSNVGANTVECEPSYPDQMVYDDCQDVQPLAWVEFPESNVLAGSATPISISGGRAPLTWSVTGNGFYLDSTGTETEVESMSSNATIHAINACGPATVTVTDGCSSIEGVILSTAGVWKLLGEFSPSRNTELFLSKGLIMCSSYGGSIDTGYTSGRQNKYWIGPYSVEPGGVVAIGGLRISYIGGLWAGTVGDVMVPAPFTEGKAEFIGQKMGGVGSCRDSNYVWHSDLNLYWFVGAQRVWEWVCP